MQYEEPYPDSFDVDENKRVIGVVTADEPATSKGAMAPQNQIVQRPVLLPMPFLQRFQQIGPSQFPLIFFFFPRIALLMMQGGMFGQSQRIGIKNITQIVRDKNGYIQEIVEFVR